MPDYPNEGALRGGHIPGAKSIPWARAINPDDGTFKTARGAEEASTAKTKQLSPDAADDRLLPHRRAQQPHLVRAEVPARLREHPQLRRLVDRVGQPGRRADREVTRMVSRSVVKSVTDARQARTTLLDTFEMFPDPADRTNMLLSYADQFKEVPPDDRDAAVRQVTPGAAVRVGRLRLGDEAAGRHAEAALRGRESVGHLGQGAGGDSRTLAVRPARRPRSPRSTATSSSASSGRTSRWAKAWA